MKLTTAKTKTTKTKTGTITVADLRAKFRIPDSATVEINDKPDAPLLDTSIVATVTHVVEAAK